MVTPQDIIQLKAFARQDALVLGGLVICTIIALVSERRTRLMFPEREKSEDDWNLFGDDEEGWSDFEDDNK